MSPSSFSLLKSFPGHPIQRVNGKSFQFTELVTFNQAGSIGLLLELLLRIVQGDSADGRICAGPQFGTPGSLQIHLQPVVSRITIRGTPNVADIQVHAPKVSQPLLDFADSC